MKLLDRLLVPIVVLAAGGVLVSTIAIGVAVSTTPLPTYSDLTWGEEL